MHLYRGIPATTDFQTVVVATMPRPLRDVFAVVVVDNIYTHTHTHTPMPTVIVYDDQVREFAAKERSSSAFYVRSVGLTSYIHVYGVSPGIVVRPFASLPPLQSPLYGGSTCSW